MLWNRRLRVLIFGLASTSILSLLCEMWFPAEGAHMRAATVWVCLPAGLLLGGIYRSGSAQVRRAMLVGVGAGLVGSMAYDLFRVPFVVAHANGVGGLPLFKVFPRFGQLLLGGATPEWAVQLAGWGYHFCNGAGFGLMYVSALDPARARRWLSGVTFAVGIEVAMLVSPYAAYFKIALSPYFVMVTLMAHAIFGLGVTWGVRRWLL